MSSKVTNNLTVEENTSAMPTDNKLTCNIEAFKTRNGLLITLETIMGVIVMAMFFSQENLPDGSQAIALAFILAILTAKFRTFLLFLSYLMSPTAADILPKTIFEFLHNLVAFLFCAPTSLGLLINISKAHHDDPMYGANIAYSVLAVVTSGLYFLSTLYTYQSFKAS